MAQPQDAATSLRIAQQVDAVRVAIAKACATVNRDPEGVRLIAVTKSQGPEVLAPLAEAGVLDFGENRLDHLDLMQAQAPANAIFHYLGRIQGRQLATVAPRVGCLHSLCDPDHLERLAKACVGRASPLPVFIQVNTSGEAAKAGLLPEQAAGFLDEVRRLANVQPIGLMTMAPEGVAESLIRATFRRLRDLAQELELPRLSMGMSQDFAIAIEEGATDVRIGTRLFSDG